MTKKRPAYVPSGPGANWGPHLLTEAMPAGERLRLALLDHGLGRMTTENWAELIQSIIEDARQEMADRAEEQESNARNAAEDLNEAKENLREVFKYLRDNPDITCQTAADALIDHEPD